MSNHDKYGPWALVTGASDGIGRGVDVLCVSPGPVHSGFADRAGMTMSSATAPDVVASQTWEAVGRKTTVVPGAQGKFLTASVKMLPRPARTAVMARVMKSMRNDLGR